MAQVPYSPIPDVSPQLTPAREIQVNTPVAAFGGAQAQGFRMLGQVSDQASNEVYQRAQAMQQLKNETDARQAAYSSTQDMSQAFAAFKNQYGDNASPDALTQYNKNLEDIRQKYRGNLTNPTAQNIYDNDAFSMMGRLSIYGAEHSADQLHQNASVSHKLAVESANNLAQINPKDGNAYNAALQQATDNTTAQAHLDGLNDQDTAQQVAIARSNVTSSRISALSRTDPITAHGLFNDAISKGDLRGEDITKLQVQLNRQDNAVTSHQIVSGIGDGTSMVLGQGKIPITRAEDAISNGIESGGNYAAQGPVIKSGMYKGQQALGRYQIMPGNLPDYLSQAGLPAMTPAQFLADNNAQDTVFDKVFGGYMDKYGSFNEAASKWFTGKSLSEGAKPEDNDRYTTLQSYLAATNKQLAASATLPDKVAAVRSEAAKIAPSNPELGDITEYRLLAKHYQDQKIQVDQANQDKNTINSAIIDQHGKGPLTVGALQQSSPDVAAAIERLPPKDQLKLQYQLVQQAKSDNTSSPEREENFNKLYALSHLDPDNFKSVDPYESDLTADQRSKLISTQKGIINGKPNQDTLVSWAFKDPTIRRQLVDAGIQIKQNSDGVYDENYLKYQGSLAAEINQSRLAGKEPGFPEIRQMATQLLQTQSGSGWFGSNFSGSPQYQHTPEAAPPPNMANRIQEIFQKQNGRTPSAQESMRIYMNMIYRQTINKAQ